MGHIQPSFRVFNKTVCDRDFLRWQIECGCRLLFSSPNRKISRARRVWLRRNLRGFVLPDEIDNASDAHLDELGESALSFLRSELNRLKQAPEPSAAEAAAIARARAEPAASWTARQ